MNKMAKPYRYNCEIAHKFNRLMEKIDDEQYKCVDVEVGWNCSSQIWAKTHPIPAYLLRTLVPRQTTINKA